MLKKSILAEDFELRFLPVEPLVTSYLSIERGRFIIIGPAIVIEDEKDRGVSEENHFPTNNETMVAQCCMLAKVTAQEHRKRYAEMGHGEF